MYSGLNGGAAGWGLCSGLRTNQGAMAEVRAVERCRGDFDLASAPWQSREMTVNLFFL